MTKIEYHEEDEREEMAMLLALAKMTREEVEKFADNIRKKIKIGEELSPYEKAYLHWEKTSTHEREPFFKKRL